ncbi:MAG: endonuclease/exonuclease/phosphatase family protein [Terrimicrobiaceae bacterium]
MKLLSRIFLIAAFSAANLAAEPIKAVFWNVEWFPGGHPNATQAEAEAQTALVQPIVAGLKPDIIGFEEIRDWEAVQIALKDLPGVGVQVCSDFVDETGAKTAQQLALASRLPAVGAWWEAWQAGSKITPKRGFSFAAFQPSEGQVLLVYVVHLKSNRGAEKELKDNIAMREESARQLLNHVAAMEKAYSALGRVSVIIGGDFNTSTDDPKFAREDTLKSLEKAGFQSCWQGKPLAQRVTLPSTPSKNPKYPPFPDACFDHVFVKGAKIVSSSVFTPESEPSDHRPVVVEVALPGTTP